MGSQICVTSLEGSVAFIYSKMQTVRAFWPKGCTCSYVRRAAIFRQAHTVECRRAFLTAFQFVSGKGNLDSIYGDWADQTRQIQNQDRIQSLKRMSRPTRTDMLVSEMSSMDKGPEQCPKYTHKVKCSQWGYPGYDWAQGVRSEFSFSLYTLLHSWIFHIHILFLYLTLAKISKSARLKTPLWVS